MDNLRRCIKNIAHHPQNLTIMDYRAEGINFMEEKTEYVTSRGIRDVIFAVSCKDILATLSVDKISQEEKDKFVKENLTSIGAGASLWKNILYDSHKFAQFNQVLQNSDEYKLDIETIVVNPIDMYDQYTLSTPHPTFGYWWPQKYQFTHWWPF